MNLTEDAAERMEHLYFGWLDFTVFGLMLGFSAIIGIYFGFCDKKQESRADYLFGGKAMSTLPVAVSLVASHFSGITLIGVPAEVFYYGTVYWLVNVSSVIVAVIVNYIYLPVFYSLQLTSSYEYLQLRFNRSVRVMASVLFTISVLLYIPLVIYVPALAFGYVSGLSLHAITPLVCIICIFYTMLGGLKAVIWIDFLQTVVIIISCMVIIIVGVVKAGGVGNVWHKSSEGGRILIFEMDPSPLARATFWSVIIGNTFSWLNYCAVNQGMIQKFLALPSISKATKSLVFFTIGMFIIKCISCFTGLIIYATYHDCDPLDAKVIERQDQLVSYYIMDIAATIPSLPGLFIAGVFSAALSSMASNLNSLAATLYEDFIRPCMKHNVTEKCASYILRFVVVIIGAICVLMVFVVENLEGILQLAYTTGGVTSGAFLGIFSLGIFFPRATPKGALAGATASLLTMAWIAVGAQKALATGTMKHTKLPTSTEGCSTVNDTMTPANNPVEPPTEVFFLFRLSFMYYTLLGSFILVVVGMTVSLLTKPMDPQDMDPNLFAPFLRKYVTKLREEGCKNNPTEKELLNVPQTKKKSLTEDD